MKIFFVTLSLFCLLPFLSSTVTAVTLNDEYPQSPKCPINGNAKVWKINFDGCMKPLREGVRRKDATEQSITFMCTCVADGIVNNQTCDELRKFEKDKSYEDKVVQSIVTHCKAVFDKNGLVNAKASK